jgi:murein DD-endopeptidase MepM/ murein hydrolase activator NlpD
MKTRTSLIIIVFILFVIITVYLVFYFNDDDKLGLPIRGKVSSKFGPRIPPTAGASTFHNGVDIDPDNNSEPLKSAISGTIVGKYFSEHGGNSLVIQTDSKWRTGYAHLASYAPGLKAGDRVKKNQVIGMPGSTGTSTGVHVHWTLKDPAGNYRDPLQYLNRTLV